VSTTSQYRVANPLDRRREHVPIILIVDDDPDGRLALQGLLIKQGYHLAFARAGAEALAKAARLIPDLIMLDVLMPEIDGFEVCRRLRATPQLAEVPIILITALNDQRSRLQGIDAGADDCISKPFDAAELQARVLMITRLNRYRRLLLERARFERVVELLPNGLLLVDVEGLICLANPAMLRMLGAEQPESVVGESLLAYIERDHHADCAACLRDVIADPASVRRIETVFIRLDGSVFQSEVDIGYFAWDDQPLAQIVVRDITARKRVEEALRTSEERQTRLYIEEQRARQVAETLRAANLALTQTLDLDTVLETFLEHLGQIVPYDSANIMLLEANSRLIVRGVRGDARLVALLTHGMTFDAGDYPHLRALLTTQASILIADTEADSSPAAPGTLQGRNWLGVPLIAGGMVIGLYALNKCEPGFFTEEHRRLAESLAAQAAVATQNARLFAEVAAGHERLQTLSRRLVDVQESERAHIARELHDEIGQMLTGLNYVLEVGPRAAPEMVKGRLAEAQALVNDLTARVRELSLDLRPAILDDLGLLPALQWLVRRYIAQTRIQVTVKHTGLERRVAPSVEIAIYRIVQEALTNVARHAGVQEATVRLWIGGGVLGVQIEDQGCGFDPDAVLSARNSWGLAGVYERAMLLGGHVIIESAPECGTRLTAELPLGIPLESIDEGR
jgi:PAS domain S-box-containing protein